MDQYILPILTAAVGVGGTLITLWYKNKQNIPVSACLTTVKPTLENGGFSFYDTQSYPESLCKYYLLEDGVKSTYHWPIIDLNDNAIGIVRVDFVKINSGLSDEDAEKLQILARQLPGYLTSPQK